MATKKEEEALAGLLKPMRYSDHVDWASDSCIENILSYRREARRLGEEKKQIVDALPEETAAKLKDLNKSIRITDSQIQRELRKVAAIEELRQALEEEEEDKEIDSSEADAAIQGFVEATEKAHQRLLAHLKNMRNKERKQERLP